MTLKTFIQTFVKTNSIVRLWTKTDGGHQPIPINDDNEYLDMEWSVAKGEHVDKEVLYVADISVSNTEYPEAINIVIEN
jgi:hypothetical protein